VAWLTDVAGVECRQIETGDRAARHTTKLSQFSTQARIQRNYIKIIKPSMAAGNSAEFGAVYPARSAARGDEPPPLNFRSPLVANCRPNRFVRPMPGVLADRWNLVRLR
jgi:hypothetical protein